MNNNKKLITGVSIKKLIRRRDERGFFEEIIRRSDDFFKEGFAQLSHSLMQAGVIKAWHIHQTQIDWWYVIKGTLMVALFDLRHDSPTSRLLNEFVLGQQGLNIVLKIPAGIAHGCKVIGSEAELLYVTSSVYNSTEEGRIAHDDADIGYDWNKSFPIE